MIEQVSGMPRDWISPASESRVVTFYSYKGGVGRTMALANIGLLLARDHGKHVIVADWDLDAPGLHKFFGLRDEEIEHGVIEYLYNYKRLVRYPKANFNVSDISIEKYLKKVETFSRSGGSIRLLAAGGQRDKAKYVDLVRGFDWDNFYRDWNGAQVIEALRTEFRKLADVTLIDSRTGVTDVGSVCTVQLPDTVVFVFVFNEQNLSGVEQVARELTNAENPAIKALGRRPDMLFVPSRKEVTELERLRQWEHKSADRLGRFCDTPIIRHSFHDVPTYLRKMSIPYIPYFAYGEELAAQSEKGYEMVAAFEPLVGLLLHKESTIWSLPETMQAFDRRQNVFMGVVTMIIVVWFGAYASLVYDYENKQGAFWILSDSVILGPYGGMLGALLAYVFYFIARRSRVTWGSRIGTLSAQLALNAVVGACAGFLAKVIILQSWFAPGLYVLAGVGGFFVFRRLIEQFAGRVFQFSR
jgi:hypothetical protein